MEKTIVENLRHLNDSLMVIALLMLVSLIIVFEAFDDTVLLRYLSIATMILYFVGLVYVIYRVRKFNERLDALSDK